MTCGICIKIKILYFFPLGSNFRNLFKCLIQLKCLIQSYTITRSHKQFFNIHKSYNKESKKNILK